MSRFSDLLGTSLSYFTLGLLGPKLKDVSGVVAVRNNADDADAALRASQVQVSGNNIELNSDAAGSGADRKLTLARPTSGMSGDLTLTLPPTAGSSGQALVTDGSGNLSFADAASTANCDKIDTTSLAFGDSSPKALFTTGAADTINKVEVIVDTPFNGTAPQLSIGVSGTTSKYMATTSVNLKVAGIYEVHPGLAAQGAEALIATYVADGSSAGAARIRIYRATPD